MTEGRIALPGAEVELLPAFLSVNDAAAALRSVREEVVWEQQRILMFGRSVAMPRLTCWIGDADAIYTYSRTTFQPRPWTPTLQDLRSRIGLRAGQAFNSVLANRYRNGSDSMGWHSDDEPELGDEPVIASLSLGAARRFCLRHRREPECRVDLLLEPGSLLLMRGATQRNYRHALPKTRVEVGERINLTFRQVSAAARATRR